MQKIEGKTNELESETKKSWKARKPESTKARRMGSYKARRLPH
jgi:hypothetical protein